MELKRQYGYTDLAWGLLVFALCLFLTGCETEAEVVLPTRIILPTATQTSTAAPSSTAKAQKATATALPTPTEETFTSSATITLTPQPDKAAARFFSGDIHTHSWLSDGKDAEANILSRAFEAYHLDYLANSDHGGVFTRNPNGQFWNDPGLPLLTLLGDSAPIKINNQEGKTVIQPGMWRWQSLRDFSWPLLFGGKDGYSVQLPGLQALYPTHLVMQGLEWNIPGHEHASMGITGQTDSAAISQFEYQYDEKDTDTSRKDLAKHNLIHGDALVALKDLVEHGDQNADVIINHPSRQLAYSAVDLREFNDMAPNVVIGLEGFPGHQKSAQRGDYNFDFSSTAETARARTYGGADYMLAKVGGMMDALWGDGRRFWVFNDSDFHSSDPAADFWPGEYNKTYTYASSLSAAHIVDGMRSGQVFIVTGDLINGLDFHAAASGQQAVMGAQLSAAAGETITVTIRFQSPPKNNHGDAVKVDHIDLIAGDVSGRTEPGSAVYNNDSNPSARVVKTFTETDWKDDNGWKTLTFAYLAANDHYLRLRGTNLGPNAPNQTQNGNPLSDALMGKNDADQAWADLWFYSNPIFVKVK